MAMSAVFLTISVVLISGTHGLDLLHGGVYDSPEAQAYWSRRFGDLFANLADIQKSSVTKNPEPTVLIEELEEENEDLSDNSVTTVEDIVTEASHLVQKQYPSFPVIYYPTSSSLYFQTPTLLF